MVLLAPPTAAPSADTTAVEQLVVCPTCGQPVSNLLAACDRTAACERAERARDLFFDRLEDR